MPEHDVRDESVREGQGGGRRQIRIVGLAVLLVSLGSPFSIEGAPGGMIAALLAMHLLVGTFSIGLLTTLADRP